MEYLNRVTFKVDFWKVNVNVASDRSFESILAELADLGADDSRDYEISGGDHIRLQSIRFVDPFWEGDMRRIRMRSAPVIAGLDGSSQLIDFEDDQGLGDDAAFLYYPRKGVLLTQRNVAAVSAARLGEYAAMKCSLKKKDIEMEPIFMVDAIKHLNQMGNIRRFEVGFANLGAMGIFDDTNLTTKEILHGFGLFQAPRATIIVSMGGNPGSLVGVPTEAKQLLKMRKGEMGDKIQRIVVSGEIDDNVEVLDLINERVIDVNEVEVDENRIVPLTARWAALRESWKRKQADIEAVQ